MQAKDIVYDGKNKDNYEYDHFNIFLFIFVSDSAWITKTVKWQCMLWTKRILNAAEAGMLLFTTKTTVSLGVKDSSLEMELLYQIFHHLFPYGPDT